jgi:hypothetical protein
MPLVEYGRSRKVIPGTPANTLAEIFLQACAAFKVDAALHALRYKKKDLDLTLPLRLANMPAGAIAELCELDAKEAAARTVQVSSVPQCAFTRDHALLPLARSMARTCPPLDAPALMLARASPHAGDAAA